MANYSEESVFNFLSELLGHHEFNLQSEINSELGLVGDDFHEMIAEFSRKFKVDMTSYLWYYHTKEEGHNLGSFFFKAPNERVERISVTPQMLLDFANQGKWTIEYPSDTPKKIRYDIILNI